MKKTNLILLALLGFGVGMSFPLPRTGHGCTDIECAKNACVVLDRQSSCCRKGGPISCTSSECGRLACPCRR